MASSTTKKALIRRYDRETLAGYINPLSFIRPEGVELLSDQANVTVVPFSEIRSLAFVREFESGSTTERAVFQTRPKTSGLWVSLRFRDGEVLEGILPNNLLLLESTGFTVIPPDPFGNLQRVWVPRASLLSVEVLGVVGSPLRKRKSKESKDQIGLFED
uniref:Uncharacterized protein n=1 Tax=Solibacter usitatus (strain Ellin6076) TaxID=234267 RepID=Q01SN9_SOLUE